MGHKEAQKSKNAEAVVRLCFACLSGLGLCSGRSSMSETGFITSKLRAALAIDSSLNGTTRGPEEHTFTGSSLPDSEENFSDWVCHLKCFLLRLLPWVKTRV